MNDNIVEIILIEDNPYDVEMTLRALKNINITNKIKILGDGEEAIQYLFGTGISEKGDLQINPKIILLDLKLPKIGGTDILRRLKSDESTKVIPVIILTSSKEETDIVKSYKLGANSYIVKPVDFEKFTDTVKELGMYWLLLNQSPN